jgi:glycosyltransferase involved in cell wall biosynthesis
MSVRSFLHRNVWQKLPRDLRRAALFGTVRALAPSVSPDALPGGPIYVAGAFRAASGIGQSARLCFSALRKCGYDARAVDVTGELFQRPSPDFGIQEGVREDGPGTIIVHAAAPFMPFVLFALGRRFVRGKRVIGYWAWELPEAPEEWRSALGYVHEIWAPSEFTAEALRKLAPDKPVRVVHHPILADDAPIDMGKPQLRDDRFTVLTIFNMGSSFARKNPLGAIAAFNLAFPDNTARMIVKAINLDHFPPAADLLRKACGSNGVELHEETATVEQMNQLFGASDVVISLHRSEGFGLILAEAMARALPVVSTDWSGTADFIDDQVGFAVPYTLIPARDPQGEYDRPSMLWAEADIAVAAEALTKLAGDRELGRTLGKNGKARCEMLFGCEAFRNAVAGSLGNTAKADGMHAS